MPASRKAKVAMTVHDFTLVLDGPVELNDTMLNALYEAGCDDATISCRAGRVFCSFDREAPTLKDAIMSAIRDVERAGIGATVLRVDHPSLVSQSDIGRQIGVSRQRIHQYAVGGASSGKFPAPVKPDAKEPLWNWTEVAQWFAEKGMLTAENLDRAKAVSAINAALEIKRHKHLDPDVTQEILRMLGMLSPASSQVTPAPSKKTKNHV